MRADLVARATPNTAPDQRQPNTVKLGVFCEGEFRQVVPFKIMQGRKIRPTRAAGIAIKHAAFAALVRTQGKGHGKIFFQPPGQEGDITLFTASSRLGKPKSLGRLRGKRRAHNARSAVIKALHQLRGHSLRTHIRTILGVSLSAALPCQQLRQHAFQTVATAACQRGSVQAHGLVKKAELALPLQKPRQSVNICICGACVSIGRVNNGVLGLLVSGRRICQRNHIPFAQTLRCLAGAPIDEHLPTFNAARRRRAPCQPHRPP